MLIYGSKLKKVTSYIKLERRCKACFAKDHTASGSYEYVHLYWIPAWVINKFVTLKCCNCGKLTVISEYRKDKDAKKFRVLFAFRKIWFHYALWWLAALLVLVTQTGKLII